MKKIFAPSAALMSRLRFGPKFAVGGIVAGALLVWLGTSQVLDLNKRVDMIRSERAATAMLADLVEWNKVLIENRRIAITTKAGDDGVRQRLKQQAGVIDKTLAKIEADVAESKPFFDMTTEVKGVRDGWTELQKKVEALPVDGDFAQKAFSAHASEYDRLYAFMRDLGNKSRLALDPDLDLFYLGYPLANHTPKTAGITVRIAAYATLNVARGAVTPKDKLFYEVTEARLSDTFSGVESLLGQSMKANPAVEQRLGKSFDALKSASKELLSYVRKSFIEVDTVTVDQAQVGRAAQASIDAAWALVEANRVAMDELLAERSATASLTRNILLFVIAGGILLSIYLFVGMYQAVKQAMDRASEAARAIARGELGKVPAATSTDEIGELLGELARADASLSNMIRAVDGAVQEIRAASGELAAGNSNLSQRTEEQASSLEETAASMEELTSTVKQNADNARQANELAASASEVAVKGGSVVGEVVTTMGGINDSSKKIADIIGVIDGIAFQTNILALNAAVEAARAGEQGRGFAVVASEVRSLAQRSAAAAKEIKTLIEDSVGKVEAGTKLVDEAGSTMAEVVSSIKRVTDIMGEITAASEEQSSGIAQVNDAITQMDHVTQQNAALVEEAAAAAESLQAQGNNLGSAVAAFKLDGRSVSASPSAPSAPVRSVAAPRAVAAKPRATRATRVKSDSHEPVAAAPRKTGTTDDWTEF